MNRYTKSESTYLRGFVFREGILHICGVVCWTDSTESVTEFALFIFIR